MKVFIKIIDEDGNQYFYPKDNTATRRYGGWKIRFRDEIPLSLADVMDDSNENIQYIEQLAKEENCTIQLVPTQQILGTYLSTYTYDSEACYKMVSYYLMITPIIMMILGYIILH